MNQEDKSALLSSLSSILGTNRSVRLFDYQPELGSALKDRIDLQGAVEQHVCIRANAFVGVSISSWSSFVHQQRAVRYGLEDHSSARWMDFALLQMTCRACNVADIEIGKGYQAMCNDDKGLGSPFRANAVCNTSKSS